MNMTRWWDLIRKSVLAWIDDYAPSMGAAIAYYTVFSLAPLLVIVIAVAGFVFGQDAVRGEIAAQLGGLIGQDGARGVQGLIESASKPAEGIFATIIGVVLLVIGATTVFAELQSALDRIWRVPVAPTENGILSLLRTRLFSFGMVLGLGFLLVVSLVASTALAALGSWWGSSFGGWEFLLQGVNFTVSLLFITLVFAMIYKIMPRAPIAWDDVWVGAAVTALLFELGKFFIGLYIGKAALTSGFGAAGSLVVLLVWVYYSAQIFLLGAEFTWVYAQEHGSQAATPEPVSAVTIPTKSGSGEMLASERAIIAADTALLPEHQAPPTEVRVCNEQVPLEKLRRHPLTGIGAALAIGLVITLAQRSVWRSDRMRKRSRSSPS